MTMDLATQPTHYVPSLDVWPGCTVFFKDGVGNGPVTDVVGEVTCLECKALWGIASTEDATDYPSFLIGLRDGMHDAYLEMEEWDPAAHDSGCECRPCSTARILLHRLLGSSTFKNPNTLI